MQWEYLNHKIPEMQLRELVAFIGNICSHQSLHFELQTAATASNFHTPPVIFISQSVSVTINGINGAPCKSVSFLTHRFDVAFFFQANEWNVILGNSSAGKLLLSLALGSCDFSLLRVIDLKKFWQREREECLFQSAKYPPRDTQSNSPGSSVPGSVSLPCTNKQHAHKSTQTFQHISLCSGVLLLVNE